MHRWSDYARAACKLQRLMACGTAVHLCHWIRLFD